MEAVLSPRSSVIRELAVTWRFIVYDISSTIMPAMLFLVAALHATQATAPQAVLSVGCGLVYFFLYIYVFAVSNQLTGIEEDRLNKPDRPLPSGLVTVSGTQYRFVIGMILFTIVGWLFGCLEWALLWQISLLINNMTPIGKTWLFKHINITLGTFAMMAAAWQIVAPITPIAMTWIVVTSLIVFPLIAIQDLRDISGDRAVGRTTLPILLGEQVSRLFIAVVFLLAPIVTHYFMVVPAGVTYSGIVCEIMLTAICLTIAVRTLQLRSKEADHRSYLLFTYWYCALLAAAIVIL